MTVVVLLSVGTFATTAYANHSWGGYHWARNANPLNLKLDDNVSTIWDARLAIASSDWSVSSVLNTTVTPGHTSSKTCRPVNGRVEVCNNKYGNNGWLGIASIWVNGSHITQGTVRLNDTYFNTAHYNTSAWRQFVVCQEVGHTFGLDHQDEIFNNPNLGTCMDYTNDPNGALFGQLDNEHPNQHDYDQLEAIYAHLDTTTTALNKKSPASANNIESSDISANDIDTGDSSEWGKVVRKSRDGHSSLHERDLGKGNKIFTFVIWAD